MEREPVSHPSVGVVVLTYRGIDWLRGCLTGITGQSEWPLPVLIVDNASGTHEGKVVAEEYGALVEWIEMTRNDGVPGGYNAGLTWACAKGLSHVLLLNHDVRLSDPSLIAQLSGATTPDVAAVGPIVRDGDGSVFSAGGDLDMRSGRSVHRVVPASPAPHEVGWLDGSCMLVSLAAAREVGGFEPRYFMYWEEVDWCVRARRAGFRLLVIPSTSLIHHRGSSTMTKSIRTQLRKNALLFQRRNSTRTEQITGLLYFLTVGAARDLAHTIRAKLSVRDEVATRALALASHCEDARRSGWRLPSVGPPIGGDDIQLPKG